MVETHPNAMPVAVSLGTAALMTWVCVQLAPPHLPDELTNRLSAAALMGSLTGVLLCEIVRRMGIARVTRALLVLGAASGFAAGVILLWQCVIHPGSHPADLLALKASGAFLCMGALLHSGARLALRDEGAEI